MRKLAQVGATAIVQALRTPFTALAQDSALATYAEKITKADAAIDWARDADTICRQVRAFNPTPGAATTWNGSGLKIWRATVVENGAAAPGTVVKVESDGIVVAAGTHAVKIAELQKAGSKRLNRGLHGFHGFIFLYPCYPCYPWSIPFCRNP